jgi:Fe(3+) dicitrate transport protein
VKTLLSWGLALHVVVALFVTRPVSAEPPADAPSEAPPDTDAPAEEEAPEAAPEAEPRAPDTVIRERRRDLFKTAGSASLIDEALLEATEYDDPQSVLAQVPGVHARTEDGYGLRPNLGIRGVTSERSQKLTLMEDGILFGPAPYSAPAAYYFPLMTRMVGLELLKGPAAILHGPQTIGGALDLATRAIPRAFGGALDLALGSAAAFDHLTAKVHGHIGASNRFGGLLGEVVHLDSGGFKQLDAPAGSTERPDTGFSRSEAMLKLGLHTDRYADSGHALELKLGFAREVSHETYLGLSDADFEENPYRRYAASALDRMDWHRTQVELTHTFRTGATELRSVAYLHLMDRVWFKLNRFAGGPELDAILADPDSPTHALYGRILEGLEDSLTEDEHLILGANDRSFEVYGLESALRHRMKTGAFRHKSVLGLRLHADGVTRRHTEDTYAMRAGRLTEEATPRRLTLANESQALAVATWLAHAVSGHGFTFTPGLRLEWIGTSQREDGSKIETSDVALLPGLGIHRELVADVGVFAGVYRGFSPIAPGQPAGVDSETSLNWETGLRWLDPESGSLAELIGFWNDYDNLVGTCTMSSGCAESALDRQFNGGAVTVLGLEVAFAHRFDLGHGLALPVRLAYTFTRGTFDTDFTSENPQFGRVEAGAPLPYVPPHQLQVQVGVAHAQAELNVAFTHVAAAPESADRDAPGARMTGALHTLDVMGRMALAEGLDLTLRGENLLGETAIGSRRPFGARPTRPIAAQLGLKWRFGAESRTAP